MFSTVLFSVTLAPTRLHETPFSLNTSFCGSITTSAVAAELTSIPLLPGEFAPLSVKGVFRKTSISAEQLRATQPPSGSLAERGALQYPPRMRCWQAGRLIFCRGARPRREQKQCREPFRILCLLARAIA